MRRDPSFDLEIAEGAECICEFGSDWDDLFVRAAEAPPFLSRSWMKTFIEEGRLSGTPVFILARSGTRLVALLPLAIRGVLNVKIAVPISGGDGAYLGLLIDPDHRAAVRDIADLIIDRSVFDIYYSGDLSSRDAATNELLDLLVRRGFSCRMIRRDPCFCMKLGCPFDEYLKMKITKGKRRYKLRYEEKKLYNSGDVKVHRYVGGEITPQINQRVAAVQRESWMKRRGAAVLGEPFCQKLLANMAEGGFGQVWLMTIDGEDAAFACSLVSHGQHHYCWPAFKLKYESALSIGQMLLMHVIRDACADGVDWFDFNYGDAEYKRFWATDSYDVFRVMLGRGFMGRLVAAACYVSLQLKQVGWFRSAFRWVRTSLRRLKQKSNGTSS